MPRVAAIAIDAAEWWYVEQLMERGRLPNLTKLRDGGARARLSTKVAYRSEMVWARFLTGREPLADKRWNVSLTFDPADYGIGTNPALSSPPFFAFGDGTKVISLDLIHAERYDGVDGIQVVGWGSHSPQYPRCSQPPGLLADLDRRFGVNPAHDNDFNVRWYEPAYIDALGDACVVGTNRRMDIALELQRQLPDWDLFLLCISEFHSVGHQFWHGVDPAHPLHGWGTSDAAGACVERVTEAIDSAIGRFVAALPDDTSVVVFAMHGMQPGDDLVSTVLLPELLHRQRFGAGLLADPDQAAWQRAGHPPAVPEPGEHWGEYMIDRFADTPKQRLRRALRGHVSRRTFNALRSLAGGERLPRLAALDKATPPETEVVDDLALARFRKPADYQTSAWYRRHWPTMPAFALPSFADGHVRINLQGREAQGIVPAAAYGMALDEVVATLEACRDARTGEPVVEDVLRVRADDPFDPEGPDADLLVIWRGAPDALVHPEVGTVGPYPHLRMAHHSPRGFALFGGPGIQAGDLGERAAADLTATVLAMLGRSVPADAIGQSLVEVV